MACGGCKGGGGRHASGGGDLKRFKFLTPQQLRYLKEKDKQAQSQPKPGDAPEGGGK